MSPDAAVRRLSQRERLDALDLASSAPMAAFDSAVGSDAYWKAGALGIWEGLFHVHRLKEAIRDEAMGPRGWP